MSKTLPKSPATVSFSFRPFEKVRSKATNADFSMHSVHQTAWFGALTTATTGDGRKPGATRTFSEGPYNFVEEQSGYKRKDCGGFESKYIQHDGKLPQFLPFALAIAAKSQFQLPSPLIFRVLLKPMPDSGTRLRSPPVERIEPPSTGISSLASRLKVVSVPPLTGLDLQHECIWLTLPP